MDTSPPDYARVATSRAISLQPAGSYVDTQATSTNKPQMASVAKVAEVTEEKQSHTEVTKGF